VFEMCKDLLTIAQYDYVKYVKLYRRIMLRVMDLLFEEGIVSREFVMCMRYIWHYLDKFKTMNKREKGDLVRKYVEMGLPRDLLIKIRNVINEEIRG